MKKGIFAMFILVASMAMVACTNANATNEGTAGENEAFKALEKRREYYKEQDKERAKMEVEMQTPTMGEETPMMAPEEDTKAQEKAMKEAAVAKEKADKEALKILEKKRKTN
ncbi:hypothetical protein LDJ99_01940 [Fusobacterium nucleatum]|uniref:RadB family lipoprotein n=1 Tax=Fusobacterium nucleatum TaxID=851 RepID=UPI0030CCF9DE